MSPTPTPTLPTRGREVLITRPYPDAEETAGRVRAAGLEPVVAPVLTVEMRGPVGLAPVDAVIVSSGNAIGALAAFRGVPLLAVGDVTAAKARAAGFADVASAGGDAADLVALAGARVARGARLLLATGLGEGEALGAGLRGAGFVVQVAVAYAVHPVPAFPGAAAAALRSGRLRAALFLSARTARVFRDLVPDALAGALGEVEALAIGAAAAAELTPLPWRRVRVSLGPTLDQVLALL